MPHHIQTRYHCPSVSNRTIKGDWRYIVPPCTRSLPPQMSHQTAEVSSFLAPDPEQPSAPTGRTPSLTGTAEPRSGHPARPVALEHTPRPRKTFWRRVRSRIWCIVGYLFVTFPLAFMICTAIYTPAEQTLPDKNGVSFGGNQLKRPN